MSFKLILGIIGIALIACSIPLFLPTPLFSFIFRIPVYQDVATEYSLFLLTTAVGLVLYIIGRKEFSNRAKGSKIASGLLMIFGLIIMVGSFGCLGVAISFLLNDIANSWATPRDLVIYLLVFVWSGLGGHIRCAMVSGWSQDSGR